MKRKLFAGLMTLFGAGVALIGALFVWIATLGESPVRLWKTEHTYYQFAPHASPWTWPIGAVIVVFGLVLVVGSLRLWIKRS